MARKVRFDHESVAEDQARLNKAQQNLMNTLFTPEHMDVPDEVIDGAFKAQQEAEEIWATGKLPEGPQEKPWPVGKPRVLRHYEREHEDDGSERVTNISIEISHPPSKDAEFILNQLLPGWIELFMKKNADYANSDNQFHTADLLGARGQFAELWRKIGKLYNSLWLGQEMQNESSEEILQDLIGHCFLAILYMHKDGK